MKEITWQKARKQDLWNVINFPYFNLNITKVNHPFENSYRVHETYKRTNKEYFNTLEEAQKAALQYCLENIDSIHFKLDNWVGNIKGDNNYFVDSKWEKFQWLKCGINEHCWTYCEYAIRFPREIDQHKIIEIGNKIMKRHKTRFIKLLTL